MSKALFKCQYCGAGMVEFFSRPRCYLKCAKCEVQTALYDEGESAIQEWLAGVDEARQRALKVEALRVDAVLQEINLEEITAREMKWLEVACELGEASYDFETIFNWIVEKECFLWRLADGIAVTQIRAYPDGQAMSLQALAGRLTLSSIEEVKNALRVKAASWDCDWVSNEVEMKVGLTWEPRALRLREIV